MPRRAVLIPIALLILAGLLAWRVRVQNARHSAPTGGSATVEGTETAVASKIAGRLAEVRVREGDRVKAGDVLAKLDCVDAEAQLEGAKARVAMADAQLLVAQAGTGQAEGAAQVASAQVATAKAQERAVEVDHEKAEKDLARVAKLHAQGAASDADYDNLMLRSKGADEQKQVVGANVRTAAAGAGASQAGVKTARAQVATATAQAQAARADLRRAELAVAECTLLAARSGVVTERLQEPGAVLPAGSRVLTVLDLSTVKLTFFVPNAELARVQLEAPAEVVADAYPKKVFTGRVRRIASEAEFTPRDVQTREDRDRLVYAVEVEVDNGEGLLRAGMPAEVTLPGTGEKPK